jgi:hypothetical protein
MILAEDRADVFAALFAVAEGWLRERGKRRVLGPFNLSINEESGLLIDGFDTPPVLLMGHDPRWSAPRIEAQGYAKAKDLIAYMYDTGNELPEKARRFIEKRNARNDEGAPARHQALPRRVRHRHRHLQRCLVAELGLHPLHRSRDRAHGQEPEAADRPDLRRDRRAERQADRLRTRPAQPERADRRFKGRLLPFNWIKLLWRMKRGARTARVPLMGIRRSFDGGLVGGLAPLLIIDAIRQALRAKGVPKVELSWILEDNRPMRHLIESFGGVAYKTYRVYEKSLAA